MKVNNPDIINNIYEKTRELIIGRGIKGWNTSELSKKVSLSKRTLYKIIGTKEDLIEKVVLSQIDKSFSFINTIIKEEGDSRKVGTRILKEGPKFLSSQQRITFPEIFNEYPGIKNKAIQRFEEVSAHLIKFLNKEIDSGQLRNDISPEFIIDLVRAIFEHYIRVGLTGETLNNTLSVAFSCMMEGISISE